MPPSATRSTGDQARAARRARRHARRVVRSRLRGRPRSSEHGHTRSKRRSARSCRSILPELLQQKSGDALKFAVAAVRRDAARLHGQARRRAAPLSPDAEPAHDQRLARDGELRLSHGSVPAAPRRRARHRLGDAERQRQVRHREAAPSRCATGRTRPISCPRHHAAREDARRDATRGVERHAPQRPRRLRQPDDHVTAGAHRSSERTVRQQPAAGPIPDEREPRRAGADRAGRLQQRHLRAEVRAECREGRLRRSDQQHRADVARDAAADGHLVLGGPGRRADRVHDRLRRTNRRRTTARRLRRCRPSAGSRSSAAGDDTAPQGASAGRARGCGPGACRDAGALPCSRQRRREHRAPVDRRTGRAHRCAAACRRRRRTPGAAGGDRELVGNAARGKSAAKSRRSTSERARRCARASCSRRAT